MSDNLSDTTDASGMYEDWFEIHNLSEHSIDIGGYYLTDKLNQPNKYQILQTFQTLQQLRLTALF